MTGRMGTAGACRGAALALAVLVAVGGMWVPRPGWAAGCVPVLEGGARSFATEGVLSATESEACFTFDVPDGSQIVAFSSQTKGQHMDVYRVMPGSGGGEAYDLPVDTTTRFDSGDPGTTDRPDRVGQGDRRFKIVVRDALLDGSEGFAFRVSMDDLADQCAAASFGRNGSFRRVFPAPVPLHDRCWTVPVPPGRRVAAQIDLEPGLLMEVGWRRVSGGSWTMVGAPAAMVESGSYEAAVDEARLFRFLVYADPSSGARPEQSGLQVFLLP